MTSSGKLLLLSGLTAVSAVIVAVLLFADGPGTVATDMAGAKSVDKSSATGAEGMESPSSADSEPTQEAGSGDDSSEIYAAADPIAAATTEACARFRSGATVADFADWLVSETGSSGEDVRDLFRAAVERALTTECPEVVPGR